MDLSTGREIKRLQVVEVVMTELVIKRVEQLASMQGFGDSLKFLDNKKRLIVPDPDLAGVDMDFQLDEFKDKDYQPPAVEHDEDLADVDDITDEEVEDLKASVITDEAEKSKQAEVFDKEEVQDQVSEQTEIMRESNEENNNEDVIEEAVNNDIEGNIHEDDVMESDDDEEPIIRRSGRVRRPPAKLSYVQVNEVDSEANNCNSAMMKEVKFADEIQNTNDTRLEMCHNIITQAVDKKNNVKYAQDQAVVIAQVMVDIRESVTAHGSSFAQRYSYKKGVKALGEAAKIGAYNEADQMHKRNAFEPIHVKDMSEQEKRKAQIGLMLIEQKEGKPAKGRLVYNGKPTREWLSREDTSSPTVSQEGLHLTIAIDAKEGRDIMSADIPNAFIQTRMEKIKKGDERIIMKIQGDVVEFLLQIAPQTYEDFVVLEKGKKTIYVVVLSAIYGMLEASMLFYQKLKSDLEAIGFKFNPYEPCVCNRIKNGNQHTVRFHVDDLLSSHIDKRVNDKFAKWLNKQYGKYGKEVKCTRGMVHEYLGMVLDFTKGKRKGVKITMYDQVADIVDTSPFSLKKGDTALTPAAKNLFEVGTGEKLDIDRKEVYHSCVAKSLFVSKRARPDIHPTVAVLSTRVKDPNESDWGKLKRLLMYLNGTRGKCLFLCIDNMSVIKWWVDAAFGVHPDFKSHTGAMMSMGSGAFQSFSRKQKLNTRSSNESELVGVDDVSVHVMWTKLFLEHQGYDVERNVVYQDNKTTMLLEMNGMKSAGKRSRAINLRYFWMTDQIKKGNVTVEYCPTEEMKADFFTKPLTGSKFYKFRKEILGEE